MLCFIFHTLMGLSSKYTSGSTFISFFVFISACRPVTPSCMRLVVIIHILRLIYPVVDVSRMEMKVMTLKAEREEFRHSKTFEY